MGDEAFRQLSKVDPKGNELLDKVGSFSDIFPAYSLFINNIIIRECNISMFFVLLLRPLPKTKVTSGLPNTTGRKLQPELCNLTPVLLERDGVLLVPYSINRHRMTTQSH